MIIPKYARYDRSVKMACEFLEIFNISQFPINPYVIIKKEKWGLITYTEMAEANECSIADTIISLGSKDGFTIYDSENFTIAYNDTQPRKRILFTILHEIGHIYLGHLVNFEHTTLYRGSLTKQENKVLENETNTFARNVLAPSVFVKYLKDKSKKNLSRYFGISYDAAKTRLELLDSDYQHAKNTEVQLRLKKLFYLFCNRYGCGNCNTIFFLKNPHYCPICGEKKLIWGGGIMKYHKYEVYEKNNKVKICPICNNEETDIEGDFCQICGKPLVNRCDNQGGNNDSFYDDPCGKYVPSNARYCPYCGNRTTFLNYEVLKDWKSEMHEKENYSESAFDLPNELDEEFPFN